MRAKALLGRSIPGSAMLFHSFEAPCNALADLQLSNRALLEIARLCNSSPTLTVSAHGVIPVILDGEKVCIEREVQINFLPVAFRALVSAS